MSNTRTCVSCGKEYEYDSKNKRGASTRCCSSCTKKNSRLNLKRIMIDASGGKCRCCGYDGHAGSFVFLESKSTFLKEPQPRSREDKLEWCKDKIPVCLNCNQEIKDNVVEMKIFNAKARPVEVGFFREDVRVETHTKSFALKDEQVNVDVLPPDETETKGQISGMRKANARVIKE